MFGTMENQELVEKLRLLDIERMMKRVMFPKLAVCKELNARRLAETYNKKEGITLKTLDQAELRDLGYGSGAKQ